jgi:hypothetical protein
VLTGSRLLQTRFGWILVAVLLSVGIGIRLSNLRIPTGRSPDETNYTKQANTLRQDGVAGLRSIALEYQSDPAARLAGPPTRLGYLAILAATVRLTGKMDETAGAVLSCAASIGTLIIVALIGVRFFPPWATLFALLFLAVSPAELELARRAWSDALVGFLGLSLVYVSCEITVNPTRRIWHVVFVLLGSLGVFVKEFGPIVFAICAIWVSWVVLVERKDFRSGLGLIAGSLAGVIISIVCIAHLLGGFPMLVQTVINWRIAHVTNQYAIEYQSGPGYLLLNAFEVVSPLSALFCTLGVAVAFLSRSRSMSTSFRLPRDVANWHVIRWVILFAIVYLALPMFLPHWLNLRYVSVLFGPFYLLAGLGVWYLAFMLSSLDSIPSIVSTCLILIGAVIGAASDIRRFDRMFVRNGIGDLSVVLILDRAEMTAAEKRVKRTPSAENYANLCRSYNRNWRYPDSVAACKKALRLKPESAEAHAELSSAYLALEMWDEAISAAQEALKLKPDSVNAKANLSQALNQKASAGLK